jgi:serine/threonine protein kinase
LAHFNDFVFNGFRNSNLSLAGMANINSAGVLELTNVTQLMLGHALYPFPLHFKNSSTNSTLSFSTTFVMSIVPRYPTLGGHGIAFLLSPFKGLQKALPSQYLGLFNASSNGKAFNHIFAVEFDTAKDFELLDIDDNHVGIDINSLISNMSTTAGYRTSNGTVQEFNLKAQKSIQCWIDFDGAENRLNVSVVPGGMPKPNRPLISIHVKLSDVLLDYMYVGFSASTGLLSSAHRILGWSFRMNGPAQDLQLSKLPEITYANSMVKTRRFRIGVSLAAVALMAVATLAAIHVIRRIRQSKVTEEWELEYGPHRFPYNELKVATKGFRDKELLGIGGFGRVYKGVIPSTGREVAVKRVSHESNQGVREFVAEIASIGLLRHRNLVQLQGWCRHKEDLLLVYDYMPNGSLDKLLFGSTQNMLTWSQRYTILKGVSLALLYLHEEWEQTVVHRDIKASNVLLDEDLNGRLGDFGLARLYEHGSNPHTSHVVGTIGYLAPELPRTGKATTSTDVFAFGALLLEVACGRKPIEPNTSPEELVLVDWVRELHSKGKLLQAADPRLLNEYPVEEVGLVLELGLLCSHPHPEARPSMREVVQMLGVDKPRPVLPSDPPLADTPTRSEHFDEFNVAFSSYKHDSSIAISHASRSSDRRPVLTPDGTSPLSLLAGTD